VADVAPRLPAGSTNSTIVPSELLTLMRNSSAPGTMSSVAVSAKSTLYVKRSRPTVSGYARVMLFSLTRAIVVRCGLLTMKPS
jgi:hypothetical protein